MNRILLLLVQEASRECSSNVYCTVVRYVRKCHECLGEYLGEDAAEGWGEQIELPT